MTSEKKFVIKAIGLELWELIVYVSSKFEKQYGFKPNIIDISNLIAQRVKQNKLF